MKTFGIWANTFQQGCQTCLLHVEGNILRSESCERFWKFVCFSDFGRKVSAFRKNSFKSRNSVKKMEKCSSTFFCLKNSAKKLACFWYHAMDFEANCRIKAFQNPWVDQKADEHEFFQTLKKFLRQGKSEKIRPNLSYWWFIRWHS